MKIGFSTLWSSEKQSEFLLKAIADAGFDGIEPTFNSGAIPGPERMVEDAAWLKHSCDNVGLSIPSMRGGRLFWKTVPSADPVERSKAADHCRRGLETVARMGGDVLLVVPGESDPDIPFYDHWKRVIEFTQHTKESAREFGVKIAFENTEAQFPVSINDWKKLFEEIDDPMIGMYLDVGNILWCGNGNPAEWIRELAKWIQRIHFKDSFPGNCIVNILEGEMDWKAVMDAVREIGYDGWILVEPEWYRFAPERLPAQLAANLKAIFEL
jgi:L-ribulose-5-phosphate 3-epimerase